MAVIAKPETMARQVYKHLREKILSGALAAGTRLVGAELAKSLEVSRTPVREAFLLLEAEGLVSPVRAGGVTVRDIRAELRDILGVREALEVHAGKLAAERMTRPMVAELSRIAAEAERLPLSAVERRARLNRDFHERLIAAAGNRRLSEIAGAYRDYFATAARLYDEETMRLSNRDHRLIIRAIEARDAEAVERLMRAHLRRALSAVEADHGRTVRPRRRTAA
ncbi:MAG: GntR family transcriptional regulator [Alphaproteobacteria bacterium]